MCNKKYLFTECQAGHNLAVVWPSGVEKTFCTNIQGCHNYTYNEATQVLSCSNCTPEYYYDGNTCYSCVASVHALNCSKTGIAVISIYQCINQSYAVINPDDGSILKCTPCSHYSFSCIYCASGQCDQCESNYYISNLTGTPVCLRCPDQLCDVCDPAYPSNCLKCRPGFHLDSNSDC